MKRSFRRRFPERHVDIVLTGVLLVMGLAPPLAAICDGTIFGDGFEGGDTSAWDNSPSSARPDGSWRFVVDFTGTPRAFVVELVARPDGRLVGYLLGGTRSRTFVGGAATGS
ncbi:MAG: hypothetical protein K8H90_05530, partial [Thermoanaerobaculia bacterium]|nr:hypothetical protein [Thermoanaerobaculia bacterium]